MGAMGAFPAVNGAEMFKDPGMVDWLRKQFDLWKADTFTSAGQLVWYDLSRIVELLYPFKELIPRISRLPRVPGDGGIAHNWKRIVAVNINNLSIGVSEGNRGGRIGVNVQQQSSTYKYMGLESSATFEARLAALNLTPDALGNSIQSTLRSVMIGEEQTLFLGNAGLALGTTPTPSVAAAAGSGTLVMGTTYVVCVALSGFGWLNGSVTNGIPGQITRINADGSQDIYGGGAAAPSAEGSHANNAGDTITATVVPVSGAVAYAWFISQTTGQTRLAAITAGPQAKFTKLPTATNQLASSLVGDNSQNALLPDGMIVQCLFGSFGSAPGTVMATNPTLPGNVVVNANSGSLTLNLANANTGFTIQGSNISEWDQFLQAAYDQYKIGFDRILMSSTDLGLTTGQMLASGSTSTPFMTIFDADAASGRIVAGRRITSYMNKFMGNDLPIEVHPYLPPGTCMFWSDRVPYELSGVSNILQIRTRMDYYQIQWPLVRRAYEYGVYMDEVIENNFPPAFGLIQGVNPVTGTPIF
jgi:hypothetical protein